jgi:error-prone DNA polymerase
VYEVPATALTPSADDIDDFTSWEKFVWTWRITGVCADCHPFAHLREHLTRLGVMPTHEAMQQRPGVRVMVAGLNIRPHRPPTRSGRTVLFTMLEDEMGILQITCVGEALEKYTAVFLLSPAVVVSGKIERKGTGASLLVEEARALRVQNAGVPSNVDEVLTPSTEIMTTTIG